jgi:hypothetical protein
MRGGVPATVASIGSSSSTIADPGVNMPVTTVLSVGARSLEAWTTTARRGFSSSRRRA